MSAPEHITTKDIAATDTDTVKQTSKQASAPSTMIETITPLRHNPRPISTNPTAQQWNAQKDHIYHLYRIQDLTHRELAQRMSETFGCRITEKMVKDRTTKWGFGKTVKAGEYEAILRSHTLDRPQPNLRHTGVWIRGKEVKRRDVERYIKRRKTGREESQSQSHNTEELLLSPTSDMQSPMSARMATFSDPSAVIHIQTPTQTQSLPQTPSTPSLAETRFDPVRDAGQTQYQQQQQLQQQQKVVYSPLPQSPYDPQSQIQTSVQGTNGRDPISGDRCRGYKRSAERLSLSPEVSFAR